MNTGSWHDMNKIGPPMSLTHEQFLEIMKPIICGYVEGYLIQQMKKEKRID